MKKLIALLAFIMESLNLGFKQIRVPPHDGVLHSRKVAESKRAFFKGDFLRFANFKKVIQRPWTKLVCKRKGIRGK